MATITVTTRDGASTTYEGEYKIKEGVLTVTPDGEPATEIRFSPVFWAKVEGPKRRTQVPRAFI